MSLYKIDENTLIDEYGVCHKDFSLRDSETMAMKEDKRN